MSAAERGTASDRGASDHVHAIAMSHGDAKSAEISKADMRRVCQASVNRRTARGVLLVTVW